MPTRIHASNSGATAKAGGTHPICFGHATALHILRVAQQHELTAPNTVQRVLPERAPSARDLGRRLEQLESAHPGLSLEKPVHVLVGNSNCRASSVCKPHVCTKALAKDSLLRLDDETFLTPAEISFIHMAAQGKDRISLLELGWEICGSYQTKRTSARSAYQVRPLTSARALRIYATKHSSMSGSRKIDQILPYLADGSASPRESKLALILGLPMMYGGYGLGIPRMNHEVVASRSARAISGRRSFRCDLCWAEAKLDVEYQSRENHEGEANRVRDSRRTNALVAMGWTVIGVTHDELDSMIATDTIAQSIRKRLGKRMQMRVSDHHARKLKLRRKLGLPAGFE